IVGAFNPAAAATSTKRALKGRPEGAGLAMGFAVWLATPCARSRSAVAVSREPSESCTKVRRVKVITELNPWVASSGSRLFHYHHAEGRSKGLLAPAAHRAALAGYGRDFPGDSHAIR